MNGSYHRDSLIPFPTSLATVTLAPVPRLIGNNISNPTMVVKLPKLPFFLPKVTQPLLIHRQVITRPRYLTMDEQKLTRQQGQQGQQGDKDQQSQIQRNHQGVTGQQSTNTTARYQLNSVYDNKRGDNIKDVLPGYQKDRDSAKTIQRELDGGIRYGGVEDTEARDQQVQSNKEPAKRNADIDTRQSRAQINKAGIKMPPNGAGECKVLKKEPLVSRRKEGRWEMHG